MRKTLSVFSLVMINIAALGGIKTWAPIAECGMASLFFLILASLTFFIPVSLISAELATSLPKAGGIYSWIKEAFGHRLAFLAIWLLWIENVIWYPTILSFIAATISFAFNPSLIHHPVYMVSLILAIFWIATILNFFGIRISSWISTLGAICGTFIPSFLIIGFGLFLYFQENTTYLDFSWNSLLPSFDLDHLVVFAGVIASFLGIEMSAVHAADVQNPKKDYSKAIFLTVIAVILFSSLGVLSITMVIPASEIALNAGCLQAFAYFLERFHLNALMPWIAITIACGALGSMSTWIVGPCVGLLASSTENDIPALLTKKNKRGVPRNLLLFQAILVSFLSFAFLFMPSINSAYWILLILTAQLYLIMYILLFAAGIKLRYKYPDLPRPFRVPGRKLGMWALGGIGILSSGFTFAIAFYPPKQFSTENPFKFIAFLIGAIVILSLLPSLAKGRRKTSEAIQENS